MIQRTLIAFDLDGTLINSSFGIYQSILFACKTYQLMPPKIDDVMANIGPPLEDYLSKIVDLSSISTRDFIQSFRKHHNSLGFKDYSLFPDVAHVLSQISQKTSLLYAVTNKPFEISVIATNELGIRGYFLSIFSPDKNSFGLKLESNKKVDILKFIKKNTDCSSYIYVGDTYADKMSAEEGGYYFIHARYGYEKDFSTKYSIDSMSELPDIISKII
jgi:phosphoglycolate phosphatase